MQASRKYEKLYTSTKTIGLTVACPVRVSTMRMALHTDNWGALNDELITLAYQDENDILRR
jgi:hypothetical protein